MKPSWMIVATFLAVWGSSGCNTQKHRSQAEPASSSAKPKDPPLRDEQDRDLARLAREHASGMEPAEEWNDRLKTGEHRDKQVILNSGRCYRAIGAGDGSVMDLDLALFDANGVVVQEDASQDAFPLIGSSEAVCPQDPGAYRLRVAMTRGSGAFRVRLYRSRQ